MHWSYADLLALPAPVYDELRDWLSESPDGEPTINMDLVLP